MSLTTLQIHNISSFFHFVYTFLKKYDKIVTVHDKPYYILDKIYYKNFCNYKGGKNMFNKDNIIGDILEQAPEKADILLEVGMHCITCPAALGETLEEACEVHGIDVNEVLEMLNKKD